MEGHMSNPRPGRRRRTQNLSLSPVYHQALRYLAERDAQDSKQDTNVSAAIRKLIDARMKSEIGRDWESVLAAAP
jgi:hypothetical protein